MEGLDDDISVRGAHRHRGIDWCELGRANIQCVWQGGCQAISRIKEPCRNQGSADHAGAAWKRKRRQCHHEAASDERPIWYHGYNTAGYRSEYGRRNVERHTPHE